MERYPLKGFLSVKDDLFVDEQSIINFSNKLTDRNDSCPENIGIFSQRLQDIFGFFESVFYCEYYKDKDRLDVFLLSDKPYSFTEIRILRERLNIAYGDVIKHFYIHQEPDDDMDPDEWIQLRNDFDDIKIERYHHHGINRTVGLIYSFDSNHYGTKYDFDDYVKSKTKGSQATVYDLFIHYLWNYMKAKKPDYHTISKYVVVNHKIKDRVLRLDVISNDVRLANDLQDEDTRKEFIKAWNTYIKDSSISNCKFLYLDDVILNIENYSKIRGAKHDE